MACGADAGGAQWRLLGRCAYSLEFHTCALGNDLSGQINAITAKYFQYFPVPNTAENPHLAQTTNLSQLNSDQGGAKATGCCEARMF